MLGVLGFSEIFEVGLDFTVFFTTDLVLEALGFLTCMLIEITSGFVTLLLTSGVWNGLFSTGDLEFGDAPRTLVSLDLAGSGVLLISLLMAFFCLPLVLLKFLAYLLIFMDAFLTSPFALGSGYSRLARI